MLPWWRDDDDSHDIWNLLERRPRRKCRWVNKSLLQRKKRKGPYRGEEWTWVSVMPSVSRTMESFNKYYPSWIERSLSAWTKAKIELNFLLRLYICKERIMRQKNRFQICLTLDWPSVRRYWGWAGHNLPWNMKTNDVATKGWKEVRCGALSPEY